LSTLTLWATCGRPSGWEGVVCLGNPEKSSEVNKLIKFLQRSSFLIFASGKGNMSQHETFVLRGNTPSFCGVNYRKLNVQVWMKMTN